MAPAHRIKAGIERIHLGKGGAGDGQLHQVVFGEQARAQAIMQVVVRIGDVIGNRRHLGFGAGIAVQLQVPFGIGLGQGIGQRGGHRAVVLGNAFQAFPGQVQPVEFGIMPFQPGDDAHGLGVVIEPAVGDHQRFHRVFAGMAEGRMAQVMGQGHGLGQIGVQVQHAGDGARDLRHFDRMGQAGAVIIALMFHEDLRLVLQAAEGRGMDDPVPVALKGRAEGRHAFGMQAATAGFGVAGIGGKHDGLTL